MLIDKPKFLSSAAGGAPASAPAPTPPSAPPVASPPAGAPTPPPASAGAAPPQPAGGGQTPLVPTPPEAPSDRSWKAIQAQEAKLREDRQKFQAERDVIEKEKSSLAQYKQASEMMSKAQTEWEADPVAFLTARGFTKEDLARRLLNEGSASPEEIFRRSQEYTNTALSTAEKRAQEATERVSKLEQQLALKEYRLDLKQALTVNAKKYGLLLPNVERSLDMALTEAGMAAQAGNQLTNDEVLDRVLSRHVENLRNYVSHEAALEQLKALLPQGTQQSGQVSAPPQVGNLPPRANGYAPIPTVQRDSDRDLVAKVLAAVNGAR